MKEIIFLGDGRDFHARDWYCAIEEACPSRTVLFTTDLIESEGRSRLITHDESILKLFNIDWLLFNKVSKFADIWRNMVKILVFPIQISILKVISWKHPNAVFHAHTMYYMFLCWISKINFIGTPQGSEILVRPYKSKIYRYFAKKSLLAADHIIIDSVNLQNSITKLCGKSSTIIQNGIDVEGIKHYINTTAPRTRITSIRGWYPNYKIEKIFEARNNCPGLPPLVLFYPFAETKYKRVISKYLTIHDLDLGRIETKAEMYRLLGTTLLAISIPESDSSPRSVYESIFCGCCVAVTYNPWIELLPVCMRSRIVIVNLDDNLWMIKAIEKARIITNKSFNPTEIALNAFDQKRSMKQVAELFY